MSGQEVAVVRNRLRKVVAEKGGSVVKFGISQADSEAMSETVLNFIFARKEDISLHEMVCPYTSFGHRPKLLIEHLGSLMLCFLLEAVHTASS